MGEIAYLAGPIGNGHTIGPRQMYANVRRAEEVMFQLIKKGYSVICPHLSYHCWINWSEDIPWERWMQMDFDFVKRADVLFYMSPEKYGESKGAKRELSLAQKLGKKIYTDLDQVPTITPDPLEEE